MGLFHVAYNGYVGKTSLPQRHPERSRGIFLAHRYSVLCETAKKGKPFAKGARKNKVQGRFLAAFEMTVWGDGFISRSVQRICLESTIPVSSSRPKPRDLSCTAVYRPMCDSGGGESFCEGSKKEQSARKISRCARNDGMGGWITHVPYKGYVGKTLFLYRHRKLSRGIFLAHRYSVLCETAEKGKTFAKGARKSGVRGRFLAALEMTVWGEWVYFT